MYSNVIGTMLGAKTAELKFDDYKFVLLKKAIRYLYGSDLVITAQDVLPLLRFADTYDVTPLLEACGKMLMKHVNPTVAIAVWMKVADYDMAPTFYVNAQKYCASVFSDVYGKDIEFTTGYFGLDENRLIDLLSDPELKVAAENDVIDAIVEWLTFNEDDRAFHAPMILK